jgi:hypothetical protein
LKEDQERTEERAAIAERPALLKKQEQNGERGKNEDPELTEESHHNRGDFFLYFRKYDAKTYNQGFKTKRCQATAGNRYTAVF